MLNLRHSYNLILYPFAFRLGFSIDNNTIDEIINLSAPAFLDCNDYHVLADPENGDICQTANIRGISVAGTR
jgi:hypothetical protein